MTDAAVFEVGLWSRPATPPPEKRPGPSVRLAFADDLDAPPPPPPDVVPRAELERAVARARLDGRREGEAAAASSAEQAMALALGRIAADLPALGEAAARAAQEASLDVARLLIAALGTALPGLAAARTAEAVVEVAQAVRPALIGGNAVARVHPLLADAAARRVAAARLVLRVIGDDEVAPGDVVVTWEGGSARRETAEIWGQVCAALRQTGLLADERSDVDEH